MVFLFISWYCLCADCGYCISLLVGVTGIGSAWFWVWWVCVWFVLLCCCFDYFLVILYLIVCCLIAVDCFRLFGVDFVNLLVVVVTCVAWYD